MLEQSKLAPRLCLEAHKVSDADSGSHERKYVEKNNVSSLPARKGKQNITQR